MGPTQLCGIGPDPIQRMEKIQERRRLLLVVATDRVSGDVTYERLKIANGGIIEGNPSSPCLDAGKLKVVEAPAPIAAAPAKAASGHIYIE